MFESRIIAQETILKSSIFFISQKYNTMKPGIKLCLVVFTTTILSSLQLSAQDISYSRLNEYRSSGLYASAVNSLNLREDNTAALATLKMYSPKAYKNFIRAFKGSTDVNVSQEGGETFIYCRMNGIINRIGYDKKGNWHHTIRYYDASHLNPDMSNSILNSYKGFELKGVTEVAYGGDIAYFVTIEALRSWKVIRIQNDAMDETESYQK
jgi:hypothetical protein